MFVVETVQSKTRKASFSPPQPSPLDKTAISNRSEDNLLGIYIGNLKDGILLHTWFCSVLFSLNYLIQFPCEYISMPHLVLVTRSPVLGSALTLPWLCHFL